MKKMITFLLILLLGLTIIKGQDNLVPNPGFEYGIRDPRCDYGTDDDGTYSQIDDAIQTDILYWQRATCDGISIGPFDFLCQYQYSAPDWMGPTFCYSSFFGFPSRFVYLEKRSQNGCQDALQTGLLAHMESNKNYMFRINYTAISGKPGATMSIPRTTIHFTKYSTNWSANWGNTKLSFSMYPPKQVSSSNPTGWLQHYVILNGPLLNSFSFSGNI